MKNVTNNHNIYKKQLIAKNHLILYSNKVVKII